MSTCKTPQLYCFVYEQISVKLASKTIDRSVSREDLRVFLGKFLHLPKPVSRKVVEELSQMGLIQEVDKFTLKVK